MHHFTDQARKNGVTLLSEGACQFCGAAYDRGVFECMENYNTALTPVDFADARHYETRFLSVDAHALQHPEIYGSWSNHFHLTRLHLILEKHVLWSYEKSPLLSDYLNAYKSIHPHETLAVPKPRERGKLTAKDFTGCASPDECMALVRAWAIEVYDAWQANIAAALQIADGFLNRRNFC